MNRFISTCVKSALSLVLFAGSVALPASAFAEENEIAANKSWTVKAVTVFPDVPSTHWASKDIAKLSALSVVSGYNGYFYPDMQVSHQDVLIMAVLLMGLRDEATSLDANTISLPFYVSDYAKAYVHTALNHGLIQESEVLEGDFAWGSAAASREWVAKIAVRIAGKSDEAALKMYPPDSFRDGNMVSADLTGYVNEVVELGIAAGFEDRTFRPKDSVLRAQVAIMLNRASGFREDLPGKPVTGTVLRNDGGTLELMTEAGVTQSFTLSDMTLTYQGNAIISSGTLASGNLVKVIALQEKAYFIDLEKLQGPVVLSGEGVVTDYQAAAKKISLSTSAGAAEYSLPEAVMETLKSVVVGDKIKYEVYGDKIVSAKIIPVVKGTIFAIETSGPTATITVEKADGELTIYRFADNVKVSSPLVTNAQLGDLYQGDQVAVELNDDKKAVKIDVVTSAVSTKYLTTVQVLVSKSKSLLVTLNDGTVAAFTLDSATYFSADSGDIPFKENMYSSLLTEGINADLTVRGSKVLKVKLSSNYSGNIVSYNRTTGELVLKVADNSTITFNVNAAATVTKSNSAKGSLSDLVAGSNVLVYSSQMQGNKVYQLKLLP